MLRKVAIRSWGRYVPWPVVQNLLASGVKVEPQLEEREVSLFFSDMAGFTSAFHKDSFMILYVSFSSHCNLLRGDVEALWRSWCQSRCYCF